MSSGTDATEHAPLVSFIVRRYGSTVRSETYWTFVGPKRSVETTEFAGNFQQISHGAQGSVSDLLLRHVHPSYLCVRPSPGARRQRPDKSCGGTQTPGEQCTRQLHDVRGRIRPRLIVSKRTEAKVRYFPGRKVASRPRTSFDAYRDRWPDLLD